MSSALRTNLGDLIARHGGSIKTGPFGTVLKAHEYSVVGVPIISVGEVGYGSFRVEKTTPRAPDKVVQRLPEYVLAFGDIVFGRKGAVDRSAWVDQEQEGWFLGSDGIRVRLPQQVHSRFIGYQLQSAETREWLLQHASGSTMASLNQGILERVPLLLPSYVAQTAIADVLGALDDKITANVRTASTTENLLHASFRAGVSGGKSDLVRVEDIVQRLQIPRRFTKDEILAVGDFPVLDQSEDGMLGFLNGDKFIEATEEAPVLYFGDHTCKLRVSSEKFLVGPNTIPFIGAGVPSVVLFCALQGLQAQEEYRRHWQSLMKKETSIPDPTWCADFARKFKVFLTLLASTKRENSILAITRDSLLPLLMAGKIRVKDAEQIVGDVV